MKKNKGGEETVLSTHMAAVLERIEEQNKATIEAVLGVDRRLTTQLEEFRAETRDQFTVVKAAIRKNSEDIRKNSEDIRKNSEDIRKNSEDIEKLGTILGANKAENVIEVLDRRVSALEKRADLQAETLVSLTRA